MKKFVLRSIGVRSIPTDIVLLVSCTTLATGGFGNASGNVFHRVLIWALKPAARLVRLSSVAVRRTKYKPNMPNMPNNKGPTTRAHLQLGLVPRDIVAFDSGHTRLGGVEYLNIHGSNLKIRRISLIQFHDD